MTVVLEGMSPAQEPRFSISGISSCGASFGVTLALWCH